MVYVYHYYISLLTLFLLLSLGAGILEDIVRRTGHTHFYQLENLDLIEMYKPLYDDPQQPIRVRNGWEQLADELGMSEKVSWKFLYEN